jgi:hypothetical protein
MAVLSPFFCLAQRLNNSVANRGWEDGPKGMDENPEGTGKTPQTPRSDEIINNK